MTHSIDCHILPTPDRGAFITAVRNFKKKHNVKFKELFSEKISSFQLRKDFISKPEIIHYMSRTSDFVGFIDDHPKFEVNKENKLKNDYYEWKIYRIIKENNIFMSPYRSHVLDDLFYNSGTKNKAQINRIVIKSSETPKNLMILDGIDPYEIRESIANLQFLGNRNICLVLTPNYKDEHAMTMLSIIEKNSNRILAMIYINSWSDYGFYSQIKRNFFITGGRDSIKFMGDDRTASIYNSFKSQLGKETLHIDRDLKVGYLLDESERYSTPQANKIHEAMQKGDIKLMHNIFKFGDKYIYRVMDTREVPFLDLSHELQTADDDQNCSIYTLNFTHAIQQLLRDDKTSDRVYQAGLDLNSQNKEEKVLAVESLTSIFKTEIKKYLPYYYNSDGTRKSDPELKDFHLKIRWDLGSKALLNHEYLQSVGFLQK